MNKCARIEMKLRIPSDSSNFRKSGEWFRKEFIVKQWNNTDKFIFDFENRAVASVSFLDEAFAKLFLEFPQEEVMHKLYKFERIVTIDKELLKEVIKVRIAENNFKNRIGIK